MVEIWYWLVVMLFAGFAVMEGWDFGVGAVYQVVARTRAERRQVVQSIGPLWNWHEVWLIAAGGTLFVAFPRVLATALSGYYLAVFLLLWCLVLRGMALEVGGHIEAPLWQQFWDGVLSFSNVMLAVLFGAAFGNVLRGVPLGADGLMFLPFFTDFRPFGQVGILDWYTVPVAAFTLVLLAAHGTVYLALKTEGAVYERSARLAKLLWRVALVLLLVVSGLTLAVRPDFFATMRHSVAGWAAVLVVAIGLGAVFVGLGSGKDRMAFAGSCSVIVGLLGGAAAAMFPVMLYSTIDPAHSMTAHAGASGAYGLGRALWWWPVALLLSVSYAAWIAGRHRGRAGVIDEPSSPDAMRKEGLV